MPLRKVNFSIAPLNDNPAQFDAGTTNILNGYSHKNGFPTIRFSIPAQDILLDTNSLYLCGQLICKGADGVAMTLADANLNTLNNNNGANEAQATSLNFSGWNGVSSVIDKVIVQSKKTQTEIQNIDHYAQYDALKKGYSFNRNDYRQVPLMRELANGLEQGHSNRRVVLTGDPATSHMADLGDKYAGQFFSIRLDVALLKSQMLHLGNEFLGGMIIVIHLTPDAQFFHSRHKRPQANPATADPTGSSYLLKNVRLEGKYVMPTPQELKAYNSQVVLNARNALMNDINSSNNSSTYTPQLSQVKSVINTFLDDDQQNNYKENGLAFRPPLGLEEYQHAKNNVRFPYDFSVKNVPNPKSSTEATGTGAGVFAPNNLMFPAHAYGDAELRLQFQKSILGGVLNSHNCAEMRLTNESLSTDYDTAAAGANGASLNIHPDILGIGADYSNGVGMVQGFVNQDYELKIVSGVNTGRGTLPQNRRNKTSIEESYLRNNTILNLQTLQKVS